MSFRLMKSRLLRGIVASAVTAVLPLSTAKAQSEVIAASAWRPAPCPTCPCPSPNQGAPTAPWMPWTGPTIPSAPNTTPAAPGTSTTPPSASTPDLNANPNAAPENAATNPSGQDFAFGGSQGLASGAATFAAPGGYLDDPIPRTNFRLRYDAGFDMNRPDRAEYFYATWRELSFHPHGITNTGGVFFDPKAGGPEQLPAKIDYQEASAYGEYAVTKRFSIFVDIPVRFVDFDGNQEDPDRESFPEPRSENVNEVSPHNNVGGISDVQYGIKAALLADPDQYLTFQFRTYIPTGEASKGLGTGHVSVEPSLLYYKRLTDRVTTQEQFTVWAPVEGGAASGPILMYGAGVSYDVYKNCGLRIAPVAEVVGWTVLYGFESEFGPTNAINEPTVRVPMTHGATDAAGDTIVNAKLGVRAYFGDRQDMYIGYGRSLTGDTWYKDIFRVEYRIGF
jgi:hypothetical protein